MNGPFISVFAMNGPFMAPPPREGPDAGAMRGVTPMEQWLLTGHQFANSG